MATNWELNLFRIDVLQLKGLYRRFQKLQKKTKQNRETNVLIVNVFIDCHLIPVYSSSNYHIPVCNRYDSVETGLFY